MTISAKQMAKKVSKLIVAENPNYDYIRELFRYVREELNIPVTTLPKRLPYVPTEEEIKKFYTAVWDAKDTKHLLMVKVLLYTGIRVSECHATFKMVH